MQGFRRFKLDQGGSAAIMFGLAALPLMGAVAGAVDYSRAASEQTKIQRAVDAVAFTLVREPTATTPADFQTRATQIFQTVYRAPSFVTSASVTASRSGKTINVASSASVQNAFMQVLGVRQTPVAASAEATSGNQRIELALVLDNTGSMADTISGQRKIDALKTAALKLLSDLRPLATDPNIVKVSVVPFDTEVRLDAPTYRNKDWFRWSNPADRVSWTGYAFDRYGTYASTDDAPVLATTNSLFPAPRDTEYRTNALLMALSTGDLAPMRPLTSLYDSTSYNDLTAVISAMKPRGYTNIALGAMWGYATLTPSEPFTEAAPLGTANVKKYMVILTDGDNTMSHINGSLQTNTTKIDTQTTTACKLTKAAGIEVFTIRLLDGDAGLLSGCATDTAHYFDVQNSGQLGTAFQSIVNAISGTRLTH